LIRDGDRIAIDVSNRRIDVDADLAKRRADFVPRSIRPAHGVFAKYRASVASAAQGAVTIPDPPPVQRPAETKAHSAREDA
ncbi:MAG: dihydroxy-acid dehydratase, partial [Alphaproteobacteria bacterium]|nr:dihydroxy-acid dehydratase [Alphaproteobacteria bacterium]